MSFGWRDGLGRKRKGGALRTHQPIHEDSRRADRRSLWSTHVDMMDERKMPEPHPRRYVLNGVEQDRGGRRSAGSRAK